MKACLNYKKIDELTLQCQTCSHFCLIKPGRVGLCGVRQNLGGKLYLLVYGRTAALGIDPIEKKPLFHFLPGTLAFSFGTLGCNFSCANCQNYDLAQISGLKGQVEKYRKIGRGHNFSPTELVSQALANECRSIAYTYSEPTIFLEYALDTMKLAKARGLKNIWVSNGFMSESALDAILPYLDGINVDIKSFSNEFYKSNCGATLEPVLKNCRRLVKAGVWLEITTLVMPTLTDDETMLKQIAEFIKNDLGDFVPWHLSAFSGAISWRLQNIPDTPAATIKRAYEIGKQEGLKYVYAGNVWASGLENTQCGSCGQPVIKRAGYEVARFDQAGKCKNCGEKIAGVFH